MSFQNWTRLSTTIGESLSLGKSQWSEIISERFTVFYDHIIIVYHKSQENGNLNTIFVDIDVDVQSQTRA